MIQWWITVFLRHGDCVLFCWNDVNESVGFIYLVKYLFCLFRLQIGKFYIALWWRIITAWRKITKKKKIKKKWRHNPQNQSKLFYIWIWKWSAFHCLGWCEGRTWKILCKDTMKQEYNVLVYNWLLIFLTVTQRWRILEETACEVMLILFYLLQSSQLELHLHLHHCHFQHKLFSLLPRLVTSLIQRSDILPTWILRILWRIMYLLTTRPVHRLARYCKTTRTLQKQSHEECVSLPRCLYRYLTNFTLRESWELDHFSYLAWLNKRSKIVMLTHCCSAKKKREMLALSVLPVPTPPIPIPPPSCRLGAAVASVSEQR